MAKQCAQNPLPNNNSIRWGCSRRKRWPGNCSNVVSRTLPHTTHPTPPHTTPPHTTPHHPTPPHTTPSTFHHLHSATFSQVFNFCKFRKFSTICDIKFFTCKPQFFAFKSVDGQHAAKSTRNAPQRDTFKVGIALLTDASSSADNGVNSVYSTELACLPRPYYITCVTCEWFRQQIHEIISTNYSQNHQCENLDPWKFSAIQYEQKQKILIFICYSYSTGARDLWQ